MRRNEAPGSRLQVCSESTYNAILLHMLSICLFEPEIPQNTGNIARTCAVTGARLHLVKPLGFDISEKAVRHAGLDYWQDVAEEMTGDRDSLKMLKKEKSSIFTAGTMNSAPAWRLCTRKLRAHLMMER